MSHEVAAAAADLEEIRRLRRELAATRADLDTLRNGVAWLGAERDRAKRWAALWKAALRAYLYAQRRMLEKWAEGSDELKTGLWRNLHACEDAAVAALDSSADAEVARILNLSDEEILAEVRAEGGDPEKIALEGRLIAERAINEVQRGDLDALRAAVARLAYARLLSDGTAARAEALAARCDAQAAALRLLVAAWRQERQWRETAQAQGWLWSDTETENHE